MRIPLSALIAAGVVMVFWWLSAVPIERGPTAAFAFLIWIVLSGFVWAYPGWHDHS